MMVNLGYKMDWTESSVVMPNRMDSFAGSAAYTEEMMDCRMDFATNKLEKHYYKTGLQLPVKMLNIKCFY